MSRYKLVYLMLALVMIGSPVAACQAPPPATPTVAPTEVAKPTPQATPVVPAAPVPATPPPAAPAAATPATAVATPAAAVPTAAVKPAAPAVAPVAGTYSGPLAQNQTLRLVLGSDARTLDPAKTNDTSSSAILHQMYESLVRYRPDLTIEPALAESWTISADGKVFTFKLRSGLKFSDGSPVTAQDFEYSIKRFLDPRTASTFASLITEEIVGANEFNSTIIPTDTVKLPQREAAVGVKATDPSTLQITLNHPASYFLWLATLVNTAPVKKDTVEKGGDKWTDPGTNIGTGPFVLKERRVGASIVLEANPNYWDKKPTLQRITVSIVEDPKAAEEAYKNNEFDISTEIPQADVDVIRKDPTLSKEIIPTAGSLGTYYIGFNTTKAPLDGEKGKLVRQAISQAVDRENIVNVVNKGVGTPGASFVPPGMVGHQPTVGLKYDPAAAKATLQKAGYADGSQLGPLELFYNTGASHKAIMEVVAAQLKQNLGINTTLQAMEFGSYLDLLEKNPPHMWRLGWIADYPHPNDFLYVVFSSKSGQNYSKYKNERFDQLVLDAAKEPDAAKQVTLYNQAQQILVDDAPALFLYWYGRFRLAKPWVKDLMPTPADGVMGEFFFRLTKIAQQ